MVHALRIAIALQKAAELLCLACELVIPRHIDGAMHLELRLIALAFFEEFELPVQMRSAFMELAARLHGRLQLIVIHGIKVFRILNEA